MSKKKDESLGNPKYNKMNRLYYFVFSAILIIFFLWSGIEVLGSGRSVMWNWYVAMLIISLIYIGFDNIKDVMGKKQYDFIDTVAIEKTPIGVRNTLLLAIGVGIMLSGSILFTNTAFINYPQFSVFDNNPVASGLLSGTAGWIENLFFFSFLFPSIFAIVYHYGIKNKITSMVVAILIISTGFSLFHVFVYGANQVALTSTFIFAMICSGSTGFLRSIVIADALHISNNFVATLSNAKLALAFVT